MVYREKPQRNVTRLTGKVQQPDADGIYWFGAPPIEAASTVSGWVNHAQVPVVTTKNDPQSIFTPIAGGMQFNAPGTYEVEATASFSVGVDANREGFGFYTTGTITPLVTPAGTVLGGHIVPVGSAASPFFTAKTTVIVGAAGATIKMQYYFQNATSRQITVGRFMVTKIASGSPGPAGPAGAAGAIGAPGATGATGKRGAMWGITPIWAFADSTDIPVTMGDGQPPQVGDFIVSNNGLGIGEVYQVAFVYPSGNVDVVAYTPALNIRGPAGATGPAGSALSHWPVDSVYISFSAGNPSALFGGTWVAIGTGRMLIGVDPADAAMDAAGDTGGSDTHVLTAANLPPHAHTINHDHAAVATTADSHSHTFAVRYDQNVPTNGSGYRVTNAGGSTGAGGTAATGSTSSDSHSHTVDLPSFSGSSGNGPGTSSPVNHLPPFLAVYMWRRTA